MPRHALPKAAASLVVAAALILNACELIDDDDEGTATDRNTTGLRAVGDADAFAREMRAALLARYARDGAYGDGRDIAVDAPIAPQAEGLSDAFAPPPDGEKAADVTPTNVQEAGVDESDRVKSDGRFLYVLDSATSDFVGPTGVPGAPEPTAGPGGDSVDGALEIDGYSDYLHPIGANHLLGIGKGAVPAPTGAEGAERGAFAQGVKLTLFDIADPGAPTELESVEIGRRGTRATALQDHHGITVQPATEDRPTRVAFGIDVADVPPDTNIEGPSTWYGWSRTGLHAFEIATGVNAGISLHGDMIVERRSDTQTWGPLRYDDRSVIVDDAVFFVHGEQVYAAPWNALGNVTGPE